MHAIHSVLEAKLLGELWGDVGTWELFNGRKQKNLWLHKFVWDIHFKTIIYEQSMWNVGLSVDEYYKWLKNFYTKWWCIPKCLPCYTSFLNYAAIDRKYTVQLCSTNAEIYTSYFCKPQPYLYFVSLIDLLKGNISTFVLTCEKYNCHCFGFPIVRACIYIHKYIGG